MMEKIHGNAVKFGTLLDKYFYRARAIGYTRERAKAILDEEMGKALTSPTRTTCNALEIASRRLAVESPCSHGHVGTFSFGCSPGVVRCDACGRRVTREDVLDSVRDAATSALSQVAPTDVAEELTRLFAEASIYALAECLRKAGLTEEEAVAVLRDHEKLKAALDANRDEVARLAPHYVSTQSGRAWFEPERK